MPQCRGAIIGDPAAPRPPHGRYCDAYIAAGRPAFPAWELSPRETGLADAPPGTRGVNTFVVWFGGGRINSVGFSYLVVFASWSLDLFSFALGARYCGLLESVPGYDFCLVYQFYWSFLVFISSMLALLGFCV